MRLGPVWRIRSWCICGIGYAWLYIWRFGSATELWLIKVWDHLDGFRCSWWEMNLTPSMIFTLNCSFCIFKWALTSWSVFMKSINNIRNFRSLHWRSWFLLVKCSSIIEWLYCSYFWHCNLSSSNILEKHVSLLDVVLEHACLINIIYL